MSVSDFYYDEINSEENLQELDNQEPTNLETAIKAKLIKSGISKEWMDSHLIIDMPTRENK